MFFCFFLPVEAHLGSGALAKVKLVKHKKSGKYYALKIMEKAVVAGTGQVHAAKQQLSYYCLYIVFWLPVFWCLVRVLAGA